MTSIDPKARAAAVYNAASDHYDAPALSFWERFGIGTVERLELSSGSRVLDVCCRSGASALAAARRVGPTGRVVGVDLAENLLELARRKAAARGLANIEFRRGDLESLDFSEESFDAVICVFGIFFLPDMAGAARELWRFVRPGGNLAVTTWGPRLFEPGDSLFWEAVREERPDLDRAFKPWDRLAEPSTLSALLKEACTRKTHHLSVEAVDGSHEITSPHDWWVIALGSGYRGTIDALESPARDRVRDRLMSALSGLRVRQVTANVVYGRARKAGDS